MSNEKLRDRARRVVRAVVPPTSALDVERDDILDEILAKCDGHVKLSIVVATLGCSPEEGQAKLQASGGSLKRALHLKTNGIALDSLT